MSKFAIAFDGFVQDRKYDSLQEAKVVWLRDIRSSHLYQYACDVYELDSCNNVVRVVSYNELKG